MRRQPARANGFTLIELLVVIAIIGVLLALEPAYQRLREAAEDARIWLAQLAVNIVDYVDEDALTDLVEWPSIFTESLRLGETPDPDVVEALLPDVKLHEDILSEFLILVNPPPEGAEGAEEIRELRLALLDARNEFRRLESDLKLLLIVMAKR